MLVCYKKMLYIYIYIQGCCNLEISLTIVGTQGRIMRVSIALETFLHLNYFIF